jgi:hypothetical protein
MSDSSEQPSASNTEKQSVDSGAPSPLLRSVAIAAHLWRNHFSPMSLPVYKRKRKDDISQERLPEPGLVHRNIARVDGLWVGLLFASILLWGILPISLQRAIEPIQYTQSDIVNSRQLATLMLDPEHPVFSNLFSKLSADSQLRWRGLAEGAQVMNDSQIARELNGLLNQPNLMPPDLVARTLSLAPLEKYTFPDEIALGFDPLARIFSNRQLIDQQSMGAVQAILSPKLTAYQTNCFRLWLLQIVLLFVAVYRAWDIFAVGVSNSPIGLSGVSDTKRSAELNKRLILTTLLSFIELVFWYAILLFGIELLGFGQFKESFVSNSSIATAPMHALQTSMSTITTIGYGTYGPNCWLTTALCFFETLTGVILLTLVVSSLISVSNRDISYPMAKAILCSGDKWSWVIGITVSAVMLVSAIGFGVLNIIPWLLFVPG